MLPPKRKWMSRNPSQHCHISRIRGRSTAGSRPSDSTFPRTEKTSSKTKRNKRQFHKWSICGRKDFLIRQFLISWIRKISKPKTGKLGVRKPFLGSSTGTHRRRRGLAFLPQMAYIRISPQWCAQVGIGWSGTGTFRAQRIYLRELISETHPCNFIGFDSMPAFGLWKGRHPQNGP